MNAPLRGLMLGDSNMQGLFIGDDETPSECLRRELQERLGLRVSVLNTGHLGYSPEQIHHTLLEYGDRFRPHFVVFSFCSNDFGSLFDPAPDRRDVQEARYWLDQITQYCRTRNIPQVITPIPLEFQVTAVRSEGTYPGRVSQPAGDGQHELLQPGRGFRGRAPSPASPVRSPRRETPFDEPPL